MSAARRAARAAIVAALLPAALVAQDWRTLTARRGIAREDALHVTVRYGIGKLTVRAADPAVLYDVSARYDADAFRFERRYDAAARTLVVGADSATAERFTLRPHLLGGDNSRAGRDSYLNVALARGLPIDLTVHIGIGDGELDLGDLWLSRLMVVVAMSETTLNFRTPNAQPMDKLTIISALGGVTLHRLGNARAKKVELDVGVGGAEVDMRGEWTGDMTLDANVSVGGLELQVPRDAGVKVQVATKLGSLDAKGFTQKDGAWVSPNWDTATRHLTVVGGAKMAGVDVSWREP